MHSGNTFLCAAFFFVCNFNHKRFFLKDFYRTVSEHLVKEHYRKRQIERENEKQLVLRGEISEDRQLQYGILKKVYFKKKNLKVFLGSLL